jgi:hypothetical protein
MSLKGEGVCSDWEYHSRVAQLARFEVNNGEENDSNMSLHRHMLSLNLILTAIATQCTVYCAVILTAHAGVRFCRCMNICSCRVLFHISGIIK